MTSIAGLNNFNNLLYNTRKIAIANNSEHQAGRVPLDLSYKRPAKIDELLNCNTKQLLHIQDLTTDMMLKWTQLF